MTESAKLYQFPKPPPGGSEEKRGPQVEDGFTRIANELFEAIITAPLTDRERRVAMAVMRLTYGWNKKADRIADSQIADVCHLPRQRVNKVKQDLIAKKVIKVEGPGHGLTSLNKHYDEWEFTARHAPKPRGDRKGDNVTHGGDKECTPRGCTPKTQDMSTSPYGEEATADAAAPRSAVKKSNLPPCPHNELLDLWAEIMPDRRQPIRSMWTKGARAKNLAARWKQGFSITNEQTGQPLYADTESGLEWWGRFFRFLRKSEFLMRDDSRFFGLDWIAKSENFEKIMELKYHGGES